MCPSVATTRLCGSRWLQKPSVIAMSLSLMPYQSLLPTTSPTSDHWLHIRPIDRDDQFNRAKNEQQKIASYLDDKN